MITDLSVGKDKALSASNSNFLRSFSLLFLVLSTLSTIEIMSLSAFSVVKVIFFSVERAFTKKHDRRGNFASINLLNFLWSMTRSLVFLSQELCAADVCCKFDWFYSTIIHFIQLIFTFSFHTTHLSLAGTNSWVPRAFSMNFCRDWINEETICQLGRCNLLRNPSKQTLIGD